MIPEFPNSAIPTVLPIRVETLSVFHAIAGRDRNMAIAAIQPIADRHHFRFEAAAVRRSGTGTARCRASRVTSLSTPAITPCRQPAIPDGGF